MSTPDVPKRDLTLPIQGRDWNGREVYIDEDGCVGNGHPSAVPVAFIVANPNYPEIDTKRDQFAEALDAFKKATSHLAWCWAHSDVSGDVLGDTYPSWRTTLLREDVTDNNDGTYSMTIYLPSFDEFAMEVAEMTVQTPAKYRVHRSKSDNRFAAVDSKTGELIGSPWFVTASEAQAWIEDKIAAEVAAELPRHDVPRIGARVITHTAFDRFPFALIEREQLGTVRAVGEDCIEIQMDHHYPGLREWDNAAICHATDLDWTDEQIDRLTTIEAAAASFHRHFTVIA